MLSYQQENLHDILDEIIKIWSVHWEGSQEQDFYGSFDPDLEQYRNLSNMGMIFCFTARKIDELCGYMICIVAPFLHKIGYKVCFLDLFFLLPEYRKGANAINMFKLCERHLKECGIKRMHVSSTVKHDISKLFERLKFNKSEIMYTKEV